VFQVLNFFKNKGKTRFSFKELGTVMQNLGNQQFNYESFKAEYDADPRLQTLVKNFDKNSIELNTGSFDSSQDQNPKSPSPDRVSQMAKRAVDL
jgi:hypothetical protein